MGRGKGKIPEAKRINFRRSKKQLLLK